MIKKANLFLTLSILVILYLVFGIISIIKNLEKYTIADSSVVIIIYILLLGLSLFLFRKYKKYNSAEYLQQEEQRLKEKRKRKEEKLKQKLNAKLNKNPYMNEDDYTSIDSGQLITIQTNDFIHKANEVCHYACNAKRLIVKNETVGHTGASSGVTLRIAKGLSYRTGGGRSKAIKKNVNYFFNGSLFITNQRIIFTAMTNGFEIPLKKITSIQLAKNGLNFQVNNKNYLIIVDRQEYPYTITNILIEENINLSTL